MTEGIHKSEKTQGESLANFVAIRPLLRIVLIHRIKFIGERSGNAWIRIDVCLHLNLLLKGHALTDHIFLLSCQALVKTDMPSPRTLNSVQSDTHGLVLWCPIDEGKVRIGYVFSQALKEKYGEENVNGEVAMAEAKKALAPFNVEFVKLDWYTLYVCLTCRLLHRLLILD